MQPRGEDSKRAGALFLTSLLLAALIVGCTGSPSPPKFSAVPKLVIDHVPEENLTKVYVHGFDDYLYTNITINITVGNETELETQNYTYFLGSVTNQMAFHLNATAWDNLTGYCYECDIEVVQTQRGGYAFMIDDAKTSSAQRYVAPYKKMLSVMMTLKNSNQ